MQIIAHLHNKVGRHRPRLCFHGFWRRKKRSNVSAWKAPVRFHLELPVYGCPRRFHLLTSGCLPSYPALFSKLWDNQIRYLEYSNSSGIWEACQRAKSADTMERGGCAKTAPHTETAAPSVGRPDVVSLGGATKPTSLRRNLLKNKS